MDNQSIVMFHILWQSVHDYEMHFMIGQGDPPENDNYKTCTDPKCKLIREAMVVA